MSDRILIACIGNVFLGDDGFGVEVARASGNKASRGGDGCGLRHPRAGSGLCLA